MKLFVVSALAIEAIAQIRLGGHLVQDFIRIGDAGEQKTDARQVHVFSRHLISTPDATEQAPANFPGAIRADSMPRHGLWLSWRRKSQALYRRRRHIPR